MLSQWYLYSISDFVPFSADAYWRLYALANGELWPLPAMVAVVAPALVPFLLWPGHAPGQRVGIVFAAAWLWVGWNFVDRRYGALNWAGSWLFWLFCLQAIGLAAQAINGWNIRRRITVRWRTAPALAVLCLGLILYPLLAPLDGRSWREAEIIALAPDPTAAVTLGWLALCGRTTRSAILLAIPLLWLAFSALTLLALDSWQSWVSTAVIVLAILAWCCQDRPDPREPRTNHDQPGDRK